MSIYADLLHPTPQLDILNRHRFDHASTTNPNTDPTTWADYNWLTPVLWSTVPDLDTVASSGNAFDLHEAVINLINTTDPSILAQALLSLPDAPLLQSNGLGLRYTHLSLYTAEPPSQYLPKDCDHLAIVTAWLIDRTHRHHPFTFASAMSSPIGIIAGWGLPQISQPQGVAA